MKKKDDMVRIDASKILQGADGNPLQWKELDGQGRVISSKDVSIGFMISDILFNEHVEQFKAMKALVLAEKFYTMELISIDEADFSGIRAMVEANQRWKPIAIGQALRYFAALKQDGEQPKEEVRETEVQEAPQE